VLTYTEGNFGARGGGMARDVPQRVLVVAQWVVLVSGFVGFVAAAPPGHRVPRIVRGWVLTTLAVIGVLVLAMLTVVIVRLPTLAVIPPGQIVAATAGRIPRATRTDVATPPDLIERGRYLFAIASCALCHGTDGGGGGKLSWRPLGTVWARNLTPDRETGLGAWTDDEISRAPFAAVSRRTGGPCTGRR
jgi:hypothetical protein